jgi:hypothetical protein
MTKQEFFTAYTQALSEGGGVTDAEMDEFGLGLPVTDQEIIDQMLGGKHDEVQENERR